MSRRSPGRPKPTRAIFPYKYGYAAVLDLGWRQGKRQRRCVYGRTEANLLSKMNEAMRSAADGVNLTIPTRTVDNWLNEWAWPQETRRHPIDDTAGLRVADRQSHRALVRDHEAQRSWAGTWNCCVGPSDARKPPPIPTATPIPGGRHG